MSDSRTTDFTGRTVVVTGASSGIGAAAARRFAALGATVAVVGRSHQKTSAVAAEIGAEAHLVDYGRLDDVRRLAGELLARYPRIDVLANNAGGFFTSRKESSDGHELTFQVNHLAPFLLTNLLLDRLEEAPNGSRVVNTASVEYRKGHLELGDLDRTRGRYRWREAYAAAKLATVVFTRELARRSEGTGVTASSFHPGSIASDVARDNALMRAIMGTRLVKAMMATPEQGAEPLLHLAGTPNATAVNGAYFDRLEREDPRNAQATDTDLARRLWERSAELTGLPATALG
ncbi:SDR family NAD(P)-dependent oxidoreductase [Streptomyces sp. HNM0645]|uniref:SDR family NAD(P)-dependent oxidoreductase n=1 Tax=Streptomyces sp. HNM0645 TaxID=2782343 RepID=UPI0024B6DDD5|nr:SDR family NAD(P)-dependent oxidoreductase [Streptomyces sp. HNM0645]MDI9884648.1 SDR family NAD(P)-dependent oxidoreductase [Streptomyces sp. HNM0645]